MKFRRNRRAGARIDITNLIDVVFVTLIFFMLATTFTRESNLRLTLPEVTQGPAVDHKKGQLELAVTAGGEFRINGKTLADGELRTIMAALHAEANGDFAQPLVVSADAKTPHELVVRAMDAAGRTGFARLSITTRVSPQGGS